MYKRQTQSKRLSSLLRVCSSQSSKKLFLVTQKFAISSSHLRSEPLPVLSLQTESFAETQRVASFVAAKPLPRKSPSNRSSDLRMMQPKSRKASSAVSASVRAQIFRSETLFRSSRCVRRSAHKPRNGKVNWEIHTAAIRLQTASR